MNKKRNEIEEAKKKIESHDGSDNVIDTIREFWGDEKTPEEESIDRISEIVDAAWGSANTKTDPDYTKITRTVADAISYVGSPLSRIFGFFKKRSFYTTLNNKFNEVEGAQFEDGEVVVDDINTEVYRDESELVFHVIYEAIEEHAKEVPRVISKVENQLRKIQGGKRFLKIAVVKGGA